jgi:NAD+ diphosphatase
VTDPELSAPPFSRAVIDRDAAERDDPTFAARFDADPSSRVLAVRGDRVLLAERFEGSEPALELRHPADLPASGLRCYLGRDADTQIELRIFDDASADLVEPEAARWQGLRAAAPVLAANHTSLAVEAVALANWHAGHAHCPRCGAPTEPVQAGWARRCEREGNLVFPRTDPAVIVLVTDHDDRVLLGSNALWEQSRFSLLAGFVEPGESLESAVIREIGEEAGLVVDRVEYVGSQPWPMPASLMLGFTARIAPGVDPLAAKADGVEILELRWFTRNEITAAFGDVVLPGETSIARWLLERWYGGPIDPEGRLPAWPTS